MTSRQAINALVSAALLLSGGCATSTSSYQETKGGFGPDTLLTESAAHLEPFERLAARLPQLKHPEYLPLLMSFSEDRKGLLIQAEGPSHLFDVILSLETTLEIAGANTRSEDFAHLRALVAELPKNTRYTSPADQTLNRRRHLELEALAWDIAAQIAHELGGPLVTDAFIEDMPAQIERFGSTLFDALVPSDSEYSALLRAKTHYEGLQASLRGGQDTILPDDSAWYPTLFGSKKPRILQLRKRLGEHGFHAPPVSNMRSFDSSMERQLKAFQERFGLNPTGRPDPASAQALNIPLSERVAEIGEALRLRRQDSQRGLDERIVLNLPAFELQHLKQGRIESTHAVVIGSNNKDIDPFTGRRGHINRTPLLSTTLTQVVLNPSWLVPRRIKELILDPLADYDPRRYDDFRLVLGPEGVEQAIQLPGPRNALGRVKFVLADTETFLHDTPGRRPFEQEERALSHGNVRVDKALTLAQRLLSADSYDITPKRVDQLLKTRNETFVTLKTPIAVQIRYTTVDVDTSGQVRFFPDVYETRLEKKRQEGRAEEVADTLTP